MSQSQNSDENTKNTLVERAHDSGRKPALIQNGSGGESFKVFTEAGISKSDYLNEKSSKG